MLIHIKNSTIKKSQIDNLREVGFAIVATQPFVLFAALTYPN